MNRSEEMEREDGDLLYQTAAVVEQQGDGIQQQDNVMEQQDNVMEQQDNVMGLNEQGVLQDMVCAGMRTTLFGHVGMSHE